MADEDEFLSEIHVGLGKCNEETVTRFFVQHEYDFRSHEPLAVDSDDDYIIKRRKKTSTYITIHHNLQTKLSAVGQQVWRGACLLGDFLLQNSNIFKDSVVLELGAGVGLLSIVASMVAQTVICTDVDVAALCLAQKNFELNHPLLKSATNIKIRRLDWLQFIGCDLVQPFNWLKEIISADSTEFSWNSEDFDWLSRIDILLAGDVVYDEALTEGFVCCVAALMKYIHLQRGVEPVLFVAVEKRYNFTLRDMDARASAFEHFLTFIQEDEPSSASSALSQDRQPPEKIFKGQRLDVETVKQVLEYERGDDMELWELKLLR